MLSIVDDELICESSFPEEIFLLNSKESEAHSSAFKVMYDATVGKLKFEDVYWWKQMPSLKPLGFGCVMTEAAPIPLLVNNNFDIGAGMIDDSPSAYPDDSLVRYCTMGMSKKNLGRLGRDIGFSDQDMSLFAERCRIYVTAPHLVDELVMEDLHALSQEESRMRGTLQPNMTAVILEDRRSGGLQLVSHGNPALAINMCSEYWDGSVITALSAEERRLVLETHQQWTQADFDVVALTYTPVPTYMQRVLAERGDEQGRNLPMYMVDNYTEDQLAAHLIEIRQQANKERAARLAMSEPVPEGIRTPSDRVGEEQELVLVAASKEEDGVHDGVIESKSRLSSSFNQSSDDLAGMVSASSEVLVTLVTDDPEIGAGLAGDDLASQKSIEDIEAGALILSPIAASGAAPFLSPDVEEGLSAKSLESFPGDYTEKSERTNALSPGPHKQQGMRIHHSSLQRLITPSMANTPDGASTPRTIKRNNSNDDIAYKGGKRSGHANRTRVLDDNVMWDVLQNQVKQCG